MKSNIRKLRNEKQISQKSLGQIIGKTQQAVSHMEQDRDKIPIESLIKMADYFGVTTDYILGIDENDSRLSSEISGISCNGSVLNEAEKMAKLVNDADTNTLYELVLVLLLRSLMEKPEKTLEPVSKGAHTKTGRE